MWVTKNEHPAAYIKMIFLALESQKMRRFCVGLAKNAHFLRVKKNEQPCSWNYNKLQLKSTSKMKYQNFGKRKSADIRETNPCVMELKYMSELRSARTNPFHEWLEEMAVVRRALHLCVKVPVGGILHNCKRWLWIACSSSPPAVNCHPVLLFPDWSCLLSRSNWATRRNCQIPTRPPRRCSRRAGYGEQCTFDDP